MNTDYLRFQASSIQQLLRRKLLQTGLLTDQMYPGSDTKIIIDLMAWLFDVMTYIFNNNISDVLYSDTYLYQNMNRLVKMLSYNPAGFSTSTCQFKISINQQNLNILHLLPDAIYIPKYAYINTGKQDSKGNDICYSFVNSYIVNIYSYIKDNKYYAKIITPQSWPVLYNGKFKKYKNKFTTTGMAYQSFILENLDLSSNNKIFVEHTMFNVIIQKLDNQTGNIIYETWERTENLVLNANQDSKLYQLRLNQKKQYVLKFGDNIYGKIPDNGSNIHIIYLQSNGQQGYIDSNQIDTNQLILQIDGITNNIQLFNMIFEDQETFKRKYGDLFITNNIFSQNCIIFNLTNNKSSSNSSGIQTIQSIRKNAPLAYKRGQRLITVSDFQSYIKQKYKAIVHDVFVANNNYYCTTFYYWLKKYNRLNVGIRQYYYKYADSCDFNNIYLWLQSAGENKISNNNLNTIINDCNNLKCATSQLVPLNAIITKFIPFVQHSNSKYSYENSSLSLDDYLKRIKIKIYKNQTAIISNQKLKELVNDIIVKYFKKQNCTIGKIINLSDITNQLMNLNYIKSIKTVNIPQQNKNQIQYINGLSFAAYTTQIVNNADFTVFNSIHCLQNFQFPKLYYSNILDMIEIINNTFNITKTEL